MSLEDTGVPKVSVVVVNHNAGRILLDCVRAVYAQALQVIVVDNASTDASLTGLENALPSASRLHVMRTGHNLGFAAGCNIGVKAAAGAYILFLNPDCVLGVDSLRRMLEVLEMDPQAGMVGGLLIDPDGREQAGGRRAMPTPWRSFVHVFGLTRLSKRWPRVFYDFNANKQALPDKPIEVEAISGALMLVRREALNAVGLWDEGYFLHCEDLDWCMRFWQKGWKILFVPDAPAVHFRGACSRARPLFVEWHKHKGMMRFYRKFFRHRYPGVLMYAVALGVWLRFGLIAAYYSARFVTRRLVYRRG